MFEREAQIGLRVWVRALLTVGSAGAWHGEGVSGAVWGRAIWCYMGPHHPCPSHAAPVPVLKKTCTKTSQAAMH